MGQIWVVFKDFAFGRTRGEPTEYVPDCDARSAYDGLGRSEPRAAPQRAEDVRSAAIILIVMQLQVFLIGCGDT